MRDSHVGVEVTEQTVGEEAAEEAEEEAGTEAGTEVRAEVGPGVGAEAVERAIGNAVEWLVAHQENDGHWDGQLSSETLVTTWLGYALWNWQDEAAEPALKWLSANQNPDGGWGAALGQPSYHDMTAMAATVLRECCPDTAAEPLRAAQSYLERNPGHYAGVLGQCLDACASGDFSRMRSPRPGVPMKRVSYLAALFPSAARRALPRMVREPLYATALGFAGQGEGVVDQAVRRRASRTLARLWDDQGRWIMPGICLVVLRKFAQRPGSAVDPAVDAVARRALAWARSTQNADGGWGWGPGGQFLDTALPVLALHEAGVPAGTPALRAAVRWIQDTMSLEGGWGPHVGSPPDADDTAAGILALVRAGRTVVRAGGTVDDRQIARARRVLEKDQAKNGSWGFPQWIGVVRAEETAFALHALLDAGVPADSKTVRAAVRWLVAHQIPRGSWGARWYVQDLNSCFRAVSALRAAGMPASHATLALARHALLAPWQHADGTPRTPDSVEDAAYSLLGLLELTPESPVVTRAAAWLVDQQQPDGTWSVAYNGLGADAEGAWLSWYKDRLFTHAHALWALARLRTVRGGV